MNMYILFQQILPIVDFQITERGSPQQQKLVFGWTLAVDGQRGALDLASEL